MEPLVVYERYVQNFNYFMLTLQRDEKTCHLSRITQSFKKNVPNDTVALVS